MYVYSSLLLEYIKQSDYLQIMNSYFLFTMSEESQVRGKLKVLRALILIV